MYKIYHKDPHSKLWSVNEPLNTALLKQPVLVKKKIEKRINIFQRKSNLPSTVWYCLLTNKMLSYKMFVYLFILRNPLTFILCHILEYYQFAMTINYCKNQFIIEWLKVVCSKLLLTLLYIMAWSKKESPVEHYVEREKRELLKELLKMQKTFFRMAS